MRFLRTGLALALLAPIPMQAGELGNITLIADAAVASASLQAPTRSTIRSTDFQVSGKLRAPSGCTNVEAASVAQPGTAVVLGSLFLVVAVVRLRAWRIRRLELMARLDE